MVINREWGLYQEIISKYKHLHHGGDRPVLDTANLVGAGGRFCKFTGSIIQLTAVENGGLSNRGSYQMCESDKITANYKAGRC